MRRYIVGKSQKRSEINILFITETTDGALAPSGGGKRTAAFDATLNLQVTSDLV